jgi:hypothetical protein
MHYEEILPYPKEFIYKSKREQIERVLKEGKIYGDKNPNYLHFVEEMAEIGEWSCKFLFLIRDGRDVVRSSMDFASGRARVYGRYEDEKESSLTQPEDDPWDFSRLRPKAGTELHKIWRDLSKFEKCAWLWAEYNRIMLEKIEKLDKSRYMIANMTKAGVKDIRQVFDFLNLKGFNEDKVSRLLFSKINTVEAVNKFPHWKEWNEELLIKFNKYAKDMMRRLGYK